LDLVKRNATHPTTNTCDNIKSFVFALMVGVAVGTYSSIFIASPITLDFTRKKEDAAA
jgi:preprotein translocase subunit SecF